MFFFCLFLVGCGNPKLPENDKNEDNKEFNITDIVTNDSVKMQINSVKKVIKECYMDISGECFGYNIPENDFYLVIDVTIENIGEKDINLSSILDFTLWQDGERSALVLFLTKSINTRLDGILKVGSSITGQIAYDVFDRDEYKFQFWDDFLKYPIKFIITKENIK